MGEIKFNSPWSHLKSHFPNYPIKTHKNRIKPSRNHPSSQAYGTREALPNHLLFYNGKRSVEKRANTLKCSTTQSPYQTASVTPLIPLHPSMSLGAALIMY